MSKKTKEKKHSNKPAAPREWNYFNHWKFHSIESYADAFSRILQHRLYVLNYPAKNGWVTTTHAIHIAIANIAPGSPENRWFLDHLVDCCVNEIWNTTYHKHYDGDDKATCKKADEMVQCFLTSLEAENEACPTCNATSGCVCNAGKRFVYLQL